MPERERGRQKAHIRPVSGDPYSYEAQGQKPLYGADKRLQGSPEEEGMTESMPFS